MCFFSKHGISILVGNQAQEKENVLVTKAGVEEEAQTEEEEMWIVNVLLESESRKYIQLRSPKAIDIQKR